jgi:ankyrin repeat protein
MISIRAARRGFVLSVLASVLVATPVLAQFSDGYNFLKAVRERKGEDVEKFINEPGSVALRTKDDATGETALHIVTQRRDLDWLRYLLQKGADPDLKDKKGTAPLLLATQLGWIDGVQGLVKYKASVDITNRSGETALIRAVQLRNPDMVRELLKAGANPDKRDTIAGLSAREYAAQDGRNSAILGIIERGGKTDTPANAGDLDFSGISDVK